MNKKNISSYFKNYIKSSSLIEDFSLTSITTNIQNSVKGDIVFYRIHENEKAEHVFCERVNKAKFSLIVVNRYVASLENYNYIVVGYTDFLTCQKIVLDDLFPNKNSLKLVGITGTNGKTTVANLCTQIAYQCGKKAFSIGTLGVLDHEKNIYPEINATTPSYVELRKIIYKFQDTYEALFFEVSSHALDQKRLNDIRLDASAWTSFSQDHLDYHKTLEEYFDAKLKISTEASTENAPLYISNLEKELKSKLSKKIKTLKVALTLKQLVISNIPSQFLAEYNVSNLEIALALNSFLWDTSEVDITKLNPPKGRFSTIELKNRIVVIDYAHTPDALINICKSIKEAFSDKVLTVVFGCGGDRDRLKRPLMAKAVERFADKIILTTDNPRTENPNQILEDTQKGFTSSKFSREIDREKAIKKSIFESNENEIILIAGKGHEEYQDVNGVKINFSDFNIANKYLKEI